MYSERDSTDASAFNLQARLEDIFENEEKIYSEKPTKLSQILNLENIRYCEEKFMNAFERTLTKAEFFRLLGDVDCENYIYSSAEDFETLFRKVDANKDNKIEWDEFISYLLLEFHEQDISSDGFTAAKQFLELPISTPVKLIRCNYHHSIVRITYFPVLNKERKINYHCGKYITASKDGIINYWSTDMVLEKTVISKISDNLKYSKTLITDITCLPDICILCVSNNEGQLRFYDTAAMKFELRLQIVNFAYPIYCMSYYFCRDIEEDSKLLLGDMGGNVLVMLITNSSFGGPFSPKAGVDIYCYDFVLKGSAPGLKMVPFCNVHQDWVLQVDYYPTLKSFVSCSAVSKVSMIICDIGQTRSPYVFNVSPFGITCFTFDEGLHVIVTGGIDWLVRIWNPFVPSKEIGICRGHHAPISSVIIQKENYMLYSVSKDMCIKVWHINTHSCIQTFSGVSSILSPLHNFPLKTFYNPEAHTLMIANKNVAIVICDKIISDTVTDGYTHIKAVTKSIYNPLYKCLVTVGMDSCIMTWDPWSGKRICLVKDAHTHVKYGEREVVEITAGTFDPTYIFLITGARDGSMKIWNFMNGDCIRNLSIERNCRVSEIIWLPERVLAVGWNRHVTEFAVNEKAWTEKFWELRHNEDVTACCVSSEALVTGSYSGELIFWKLFTGRPYKKCLVSDPDKKYKIEFNKLSEKQSDLSTSYTSKIYSLSASKSNIQSLRSTDGFIKGSVHKVNRMKSNISMMQILNDKSHQASEVLHYPKQLISSSNTMLSPCSSNLSPISKVSGSLSSPVSEDDFIPVHALLSLTARPFKKYWGTLLASIDTGVIQVWSHHKMSRLIAKFNAYYVPEDYVMAMASDLKNMYLFTGDTGGYIRVWLMTNYAVPANEIIPIDFATLEETFYYLQVYKINRAALTYPILLSHYHGHSGTVTHLEYLDSIKVLISCSVDKTVRFWTLGGQYIGTLGTQTWIPVSPDHIFTSDSMKEYRVPPDIKRIASEQTLNIIGHTSRVYQSDDDDDRKHTVEMSLRHKNIKPLIYGKRLKEPYLGHHFKLPSRGLRIKHTPKINLKIGPVIQLYANMTLQKLQDINEISLPPTVPITGKEKSKRKVTLSNSSVTKFSVRSQTILKRSSGEDNVSKTRFKH